MHVLLRVIRLTERLLCILFWVLLLLGFHAPPLAMMTVTCAAMHEGGHLLALACLGRHAGAPLHRLNGFLLPTVGVLSYKEELIVTAAGPLVNLLFSPLCLCLLPFGGDFFLTLCYVSLCTGLCNLVPIGGYDGKRLLYILICLRWGSTVADTVCRRLSLVTSATLTLLSLYLIWRADTGYWLFGVFFASMLAHMSHELKGRRRILSNREKNGAIER